MDEADRLCDRIAIVDHGKLVALDTPAALKASVPGSNVIEVQFENPPADWEQRLHKLAGCHLGAARGRGHVPRADRQRFAHDDRNWWKWRCTAGVRVKSLSVQNTTLDDVFVHYTGRQLRDELVKAYAFVMPQAPGVAAMNRMMAIVEREMRKFFRSPALMLASMIFPLVQLIMLGNAFGGKISDARLGVVDQDGGTQALKIREAFDSVRANMRTFVPVYYDNEKQAHAKTCATARFRARSSFRRSIRGACTSRTIRRSRWWSTTATTS